MYNNLVEETSGAAVLTSYSLLRSIRHSEMWTFFSYLFCQKLCWPFNRNDFRKPGSLHLPQLMEMKWNCLPRGNDWLLLLGIESAWCLCWLLNCYKKWPFKRNVYTKGMLWQHDWVVYSCSQKTQIQMH